MTQLPESTGILIIGGGPAGLTAAYELTDADRPVLVVEMSDHVGGISRTESYKGYRFDIGGHRFYTKVSEVRDLWHEVMGDDFQLRSRMSRIYYNNKFFAYPLVFFDALFKLGIIESFLILLSYIKARLFPRKPEETFEDWVINRFGKRLFDKFFRTYTEKVWGISVKEIRADWAAQRIKKLSLRSAVYNALFQPKGDDITTLINQFHYPPHGPGMMWERFRCIVEDKGGSVAMETKATQLYIEDGRVTRVVLQEKGSDEQEIEVEDVISSMPLAKLIHSLHPAPPDDVLQAADDLEYRDFLVVCLIVDQEKLFPDNWIYVHSPEVHVGRIQNFKNWSPDMVPDASKTSLGMEYFCNRGDHIWEQSTEELIELAATELAHLGLADANDVIDGTVIRQLKAYPVYDETYRQNVAVIKSYLDTIDNLQTVGRNGLHRYNNQDHSMLTGLLAARNLLGESHDVWLVNTDRSYYESFVVDDDSEQQKHRTLSGDESSDGSKHLKQQ